MFVFFVRYLLRVLKMSRGSGRSATIARTGTNLFGTRRAKMVGSDTWTGQLVELMGVIVSWG